MAFEKAQPKIPAAIGDLSVVLIDYEVAPVDEDGNPQENLRQQARFEVQVKDADGEVIHVVSGDLAPHLTQQQIDQLKAFLDAMRMKAEAEILP